VVDATHLSGGYDIKLIWRPMDDAAVAEAKGFGMQMEWMSITFLLQ
jgi:hypothetical protein